MPPRSCFQHRVDAADAMKAYLRRQTTPMHDAILLLADGTVFHGQAIGAPGTATGEICFNTGMTGYQEIFTDPSYFGQIIVMTNAHIGNYGTMDLDDESDSFKINGLVTKTFSRTASRARSERTVQDDLEAQGITGITGVDTRAIVRHIRDKGAMNCIISSEETDVHVLQKQLDDVPSMDGLELASRVSTAEPFETGAIGAELRVAVLDFGIKRNILRCLEERDLHLKVFPARTSFDELMAFEPHGLFLSNGPGDPAPMDYAVETVRTAQDAGLPIFGICLGHQILARANDVGTFKMHHGHRGINHPVQNVERGTSEITSQNHGFEISRADVEANGTVRITHVNLNDDTVEGLHVEGRPAFSVQYHPEASPGPHDSRYLFDQFVHTIRQIATV